MIVYTSYGVPVYHRMRGDIPGCIGPSDRVVKDSCCMKDAGLSCENPRSCITKDPHIRFKPKEIR